MRIMAIDYGDTRTGVAVSDLSCTMAGDAWTITERDPMKLADMIIDEYKRRDVGKIVLGYPRNMDGSAGFRAEKSEDFAQLLRDREEIEIIFWDERRTTVSADSILKNAGKRGKKKKNVLDAVAASLILEGYLASLK